MSRYNPKKTKLVVSQETIVLVEVVAFVAAIAVVTGIIKGFGKLVKLTEAKFNALGDKKKATTKVSKLEKSLERLNTLDALFKENKDIKIKPANINISLFDKAKSLPEFIKNNDASMKETDKLLRLLIPFSLQLSKYCDEYADEKYDEFEFESILEKHLLKYAETFKRAYGSNKAVLVGGMNAYIFENKTVYVEDAIPDPNQQEFADLNASLFGKLLQQVAGYLKLYELSLSGDYANYAQQETEWSLFYPDILLDKVDALLTFAEQSVGT